VGNAINSSKAANVNAHTLWWVTHSKKNPTKQQFNYNKKNLPDGGCKSDSSLDEIVTLSLSASGSTSPVSANVLFSDSMSLAVSLSGSLSWDRV
jgi:hypothetical protein